MSEVEKWIEEAAKANQAYQISCADALERQGSSFLNLLLGGGGGALAYALNLADKAAAKWQIYGMAAASLWLFFLAAIVLLRVLWTGQLYGPANDPKNLLLGADLPLSELQRFELENRQFCIDANRTRTVQVSRWLNWTRFAAAAITPVVFSTAAWLAYIRP